MDRINRSERSWRLASGSSNIGHWEIIRSLSIHFAHSFVDIRPLNFYSLTNHRMLLTLILIWQPQMNEGLFWVLCYLASSKLLTTNRYHLPARCPEKGMKFMVRRWGGVAEEARCKGRNSQISYRNGVIEKISFHWKKIFFRSKEI